ncbi:hypothetical protein COUCH_16635 [Couchioplanes caeruleus]|uniref:hypothetical protein n=1 Tax=Couchioplanes caeruleus TaxID=56438 RepID=UPI0020C0AB48|nr:hypothetical protein [Couchioplanes caeruleus]UQU67797.1 hypothetical protein COUCH_16635 [Couchioplanes caeruleus]
MSDRPTAPPVQPCPTRPWQQAGHPPIRLEPTSDPVYPYALQIGDHTATTLAMTAAGVRALRDALTALLAHTTPAETEDFVAEWARAHNAVVAETPGAPARADGAPGRYVMVA